MHVEFRLVIIMRRIIMAIVAVGILTLTACNTGKVDEKLTTDTNVKSSGVDINAQ